ncbi:MAG TPA: alpha/beta hydrolase, partial [Xanthobacteraceae bacterium]|nr:alpha/beta hydrolase [Xanthobacteraceae bacterium]
KHVAYGDEPHQFGELWLPKTKGPYPVVVLIHGGCWLAALPGVELMAYMAGDLRKRGNAVWNIEYRRLGDVGGGYPGTFEDIANAIDHLQTLKKSVPLDLTNIVVVGHSAGGHLALWAAARSRLPKNSPLRSEKPLPIKAVVTLAGIPDLAAYRARGDGACGVPRTIDQLIAGNRSANPFLDTSPAALLPVRIPQVVISGALDPIVPPMFGRDYAAKASAAGDAVRELTIKDAGHFELIDPRSRAFETIRAEIERLQKAR